jgi:DNA-binding NarL/FixJ family response regulator
MTTRILIADDHEVMRRHIRHALEDDKELEIVAEAGDGEEAIQKTLAVGPDLVIMDLSMPRLDGLSAAEQIKRNFPGTMVIMFSMHKLKDLIKTAKELGLNGFVSKQEDGPNLPRAVEAVIHHRPYFPDVHSPSPC